MKYTKITNPTYASNEWHIIIIPTVLYTGPRWDWCRDYPSKGTFFCLWNNNNLPSEYWHFELKEDALIFALKWGAKKPLTAFAGNKI